MFVLFTDFGLTGPYTGQMKAVLHRGMPQIPLVDLFADAPVWDIQASAYLLAAYAEKFKEGDIFICVVDPGVGSDRHWGVLEADGRWFVGPENGLFELIRRRAKTGRWWRGEWKPEDLSNSFHGRDIFAPMAIKIAKKEKNLGKLMELEEIGCKNWPDDLCKIVYIDHYGNAMTGIRGETMDKNSTLQVMGKQVHYANTFSSVPKGQAFWYENSNGLVEIATNLGRANKELCLEIGSEVNIYK